MKKTLGSAHVICWAKISSLPTAKLWGNSWNRYSSLSLLHNK